MKEWQDANSQLHMPQKQASIRATNPERTITKGTEVTVVARSWGGRGRLEPNGHAALIVNVGTKERPDHWVIQGGPSQIDGQSKLVLRGGGAQAPTDGWYQAFSRTGGLNWDDKRQVLSVPVVTIRTETLQVKITDQDIERATEIVGNRIKDVTYHPTGPNSNTYVRLVMEELHIDTSAIDSLSKKKGVELHGWSTKLQ